MEKRGLASRIMRIVSVLGIICLLALQWVWWRNAYEAVEVDFMKDTQVCLEQAFDKSLTRVMDGKYKKKMRVVREKDAPNLKSITKHSANNPSEFSFLIEEMLEIENNPITYNQIEEEFIACLQEKFEMVPKFKIELHKTSNVIDSINKPKYNRMTYGTKQDTIYHQYGFSSFAVVTLSSPITLYLKKGAFILVVSIVLMFLIGTILVLQFVNMQRDRKFAEFIKDYTRMIAHELRTPVTGAQHVYQSISKLKSTDTELRDNYVKDGIGLTKKILLNLDNILYMAKSEQRKLSVYWMEVDMRTFVENIVNQYRERDYNPKIVQIDTYYKPENFKCRLDIQLMENALCNLLDNAIKYTHEDTKIQVYCFRVDETIVIKVKDNGMGMSEEDQKRVFDLFERGSTGKNKIFPGFGIGLHFVERVVKAHGGKITVQSAPEKGTEFTIKYIS